MGRNIELEEYLKYWFASFPGIGMARKKELLQKLSLEELFNIEETDSRFWSETGISAKEVTAIQESRKTRKWKEEWNRFAEHGIRIVWQKDAAYPDRLKALPGMPLVLFYKGKLPKEAQLSAAIVGSRRPSAYGQKTTMKLAEALAEEGVQIISGMAKGIDGIAHRGALNVQGETFAVLGGGVDVCYPKEHRGLYRDLCEKGGVISEYLPGTAPLGVHFPARNRIVSGLADFIVVAEAKQKSGSLITADFGLEQGKDIFALPGPVTSELSMGCNQLIRQGAQIIVSIEDLFEELQIKNLQNNSFEEENFSKNENNLESEENMVYSLLGLYPKSRGEMAYETQLSPRELSVILTTLVMEGYAEEVSRDYYIKRK